jgi:hypothetical protein
MGGNPRFLSSWERKVAAGRNPGVRGCEGAPTKPVAFGSAILYGVRPMPPPAARTTGDGGRAERRQYRESRSGRAVGELDRPAWGGAGRGVGRKRAGAEDGGVLVGEVGSERRLGVGGTRVLRPDGRTRRECPLPQGPRTKVFLGVDADD